MTAGNQSIVTAFEELGMTPEQIAEQEGYDIVSIKSILMQNSSLYRKACKVEDSLDFTDEEAQMAKSVLVNLARYSEDENLQMRAATFIIQDKKGRLDLKNQMTGMNVNVALFDSQLVRALEAVARAKEPKRIVNVEAELVSK